MTKSVQLNAAERAVYHLAEAGGLDALHAPLYRRQIASLVRAGLLVPASAGAYAAVPSRGSEPPPADEPPMSARPSGRVRITRATDAPRTSAPPTSTEPYDVLNVRIPKSWLEQLDAMGPTRAEAARQVLGRGLAAASGTRRAVSGQ